MRRMRVSTFTTYIALAPLLLAIAMARNAVAAENPEADNVSPVETAPSRLCPMLVEPPSRILETWSQLPPEGQPAAVAPPIQMEADDVALQEEGISRLQGDVWLQQGEHFLSAQALEFNQETGVVETLSPARFGSRQLIIDAETARYDTSAGQGKFTDSDFYLLKRNARGEADLLERTGDTTARLEGVKYSSCPPEDEDWWLKASSMDLDQDAGMATARNVRIAFMGVPFFYTPWISFPIDEQRKSGFLFPEFGDSGRTGPWLRVPYYFNLDEQYDATIEPYYMEERGTAVNGEFRYLFNWGLGELDAEYLDNDLLTDTRRYNYHLRHLSMLPGDWRASLSYQQVSDEEYFQDFSADGRGNLRSHVAQQFMLMKNELEYGASVQLLRYQTVDPTIAESRRPYEKWPAINYYYAPLALADAVWLEVEGESVNFQRDGRVSGWRHHVEPAFSMDIGNPGLRLTPRLAWWQTRYELEQPDETALDISRGLPVASLDLRARMSRDLDNGGIQTLEPRLFYLNIPYENQAAIPLFDTNTGSETLASLFRENRFSNVDRVGDVERISFGLGSALINAQGREWLRTTIARGWYLEDRRVQRSAIAEPDTESASNYFAELEYTPTERQGVRLDLSWEPDNDKFDYGSVQYQYKASNYAVFNMAYRYRRDFTSAISTGPLEQADISFATPLGGRWGLFGRAVYSIEDERSQETLAGFEYENCCWIFRTFNRRFVFNRDGEFDQSLWFQLELKGLSSVGRRIDEFLQQDIYGYGETP